MDNMVEEGGLEGGDHPPLGGGAGGEPGGGRGDFCPEIAASSLQSERYARLVFLGPRNRSVQTLGGSWFRTWAQDFAGAKRKKTRFGQ